MGCKLCCKEAVVARNMPNLQKLTKNHLRTICFEYKIPYNRSATNEQLCDLIKKHFKNDVPDRVLALRVLELGPVSKELRQQVWSTYVGATVDRAPCKICGDEIKRKSAGWHASHVVAASNGGETTLANLRPLCATCNIAMKNEHMRDYVLRVAPDKLDGLRL